MNLKTSSKENKKTVLIGRPCGSLEYGDEASQYILKVVTLHPKTTNQIKEEVKAKYFNKIHHYTVSRILETLYRKGNIRKQIIGKVTIWLK
jgi:hypothetical protein